MVYDLLLFRDGSLKYPFYENLDFRIQVFSDRLFPSHFAPKKIYFLSLSNEVMGRKFFNELLMKLFVKVHFLSVS